MSRIINRAVQSTNEPAGRVHVRTLVGRPGRNNLGHRRRRGRHAHEWQLLQHLLQATHSRCGTRAFLMGAGLSTCSPGTLKLGYPVGKFPHVPRASRWSFRSGTKPAGRDGRVWG